MDAVALLRQQAAMADGLLTQVFAAVTPEQAVWQPAGGVVNAAATVFLHLYFTEDRVIQGQQQRAPLMVAEGWQERLNFDVNNIWATPQTPDLDRYRSYARRVREATAAYLETLPNEDLAREIETPRGKQPFSNRLTVMLLLHKMTHTGEIAALLGSQGLKGFPI